MRALRRTASVLSALCLTAGPGVACPTCRDALAVSGASWAQGFSLSVLFLLGTLAVVVGTFACALWRATRNAHEE